MTREELEHIIRASADITGQYEFIIVGSQSILGPVPNPESVFTMSAEADIYPLQAPDLAEKIDGAMGEGSQFHETHGYYAQGVGPDTAILPSGWLERVHRACARPMRSNHCGKRPRPSKGPGSNIPMPGFSYAQTSVWRC